MKQQTKQETQIPKLKIPEQDLKHFLMDSLVIDPFWYDLYGIDENNNDNSKK